jgi:type I restriction enzyme S subunit
METMEMTSAAAVGKPGYKLTSIGWLPEEWEVKTLAEIVDEKRPIVYGIVQAGPEVSGGVPYLKTGDLTSEIDIDSLCRTSVEIAKQYFRSQIFTGDIVMSLRGNIGVLRVVPPELDGANITRGVARVAIADATDRDFVYQALSDEGTIQRLGGNSKGSTFQEINLHNLRLFPLPWPSDKERAVIADTLASFDKVTCNLSKLLAAKRTYKRGLMQQLLTGQRRFPEFQGRPLPLVAIGEMITESRESLPVSNSRERITVRLNLNGVEARDVRGTESEDATVYYLRRAGQFIYGKQNLHKGAMGIIPAELDGFSSTQDMPTFDFADTVDPQWFLYLMSREDFYLNLEKIATGTGSKRIQPANLFKIKVPFPSLPEQQRIAAVLTACGQEIDLLQAQLRQWQQQKKGLMQQLLTGQVRVPH